MNEFIEPEATGSCDTCGIEYDLSDTNRRCGECGDCGKCCSHYLVPEYVSRFTFELRTGIETLQELGIKTRREAYDAIREMMADYITGIGFDSISEIIDGTEIFEIPDNL